MKPESMAVIEALLDDVQAEGDERTLLLGTLTGLVAEILDIELPASADEASPEEITDRPRAHGAGVIETCEHSPLDTATQALLQGAVNLHPELGKALAGKESRP